MRLLPLVGLAALVLLFLPKEASNALIKKLPQEKSSHTSSHNITENEYPYFTPKMIDECGLTSYTGLKEPLTPLDKSLGFVKTHKTGGSTVAGIINRIVDGRNLTKMIPTDLIRLGWPWELLPAGCWGVDRVLQNIGKYDAIANHALFDRETFSHYLKDPMITFTVLREPISRYISGYNWFKHPFSSWREHLDHSKQMKTITDRHGVIFLNSMAYDLGWYHQHDFSTEYDQDIDKIYEFIDQLDRDLNMVMITEYMEESLLLLRELFLPALDVTELVFHDFKTNDEQEKVYPTPAEEKELAHLILVDRLLYRHFQQKLVGLWESQIKSNPEMMELREGLVCLNERVANESGVPDLLLERMAMDSIAFTKVLKEKQLEKVTDPLEKDEEPVRARKRPQQMMRHKRHAGSESSR